MRTRDANLTIDQTLDHIMRVRKCTRAEAMAALDAAVRRGAIAATGINSATMRREPMIAAEAGAVFRRLASAKRGAQKT